MTRKVFDLIASIGGVLIIAILLVAGGLLMWAYTFTSNNVRTQLAQQEITFPAKGSPALASPKIGPYLNKYAGQQLLTGSQAKAYADHFIGVHLSEMPFNGVYSRVSAAAMADPTNEKLQAQVQTVFQGTTLRGLLLEAYAFSTFGTIALWSAIAAFVAAFLMAVLVGFGFWHERRTPADEPLLQGAQPAGAVSGPPPAPAT